MTELKNLKHESFAKSVVEHKGNISEAYRDVYDPQANGSAGASASRLLDTVSVRDRVIALMKENGIDLKGLTKKLTEHVNDGDKRLSLDATKFSYKLQGAVDQDNPVPSSHQHIHLHANELQSLDPAAKLAKLRNLLK